MTQDPSTHGAPPAGSTAEPSSRTSEATDATGASGAIEGRPRPVPTAPASPPLTTPAGPGVGDLEGLDDLPVAEHVERFTRVHDALRARLDGAPDTGPQR